MTHRSVGRRTVPKIFILGRLVGGHYAIAALERAGKLDAWIANSPETLADAEET